VLNWTESKRTVRSDAKLPGRASGSIPGSSTKWAADERPLFFDCGPHINIASNIYEYRDGGVSAKSYGRLSLTRISERRTSRQNSSAPMSARPFIGNQRANG
jgi:hypothetical protein